MDLECGAARAGEGEKVDECGVRETDVVRGLRMNGREGKRKVQRESDFHRLLCLREGMEEKANRFK